MDLVPGRQGKLDGENRIHAPAATKAVTIHLAALNAIERALIDALPRECCGLLLGRGDEVRAAVAVPNRAAAPDRFDIDPLTAARVELSARRAGQELLGYFHSHPHGRPAPSHRDMAGALWPAWGATLHLICASRYQFAMYRVAPNSWERVRLRVVDTREAGVAWASGDSGVACASIDTRMAWASGYLGVAWASGFGPRDGKEDAPSRLPVPRTHAARASGEQDHPRQAAPLSAACPCHPDADSRHPHAASAHA